MTHLTDEQLNELLDEGTQVDTYTGTHAHLTPDTSHLTPVTRHLATCDDCRARLEELQRVFTALDSLPEVPLTRDLTQSILAQLPPSWSEMISRLTSAQKWLFAAQSLTALAVFAWLASTFIIPPEITNYQLPTLDSLPASFFLLFSASLQTSTIDTALASFIQTLSTSASEIQSSSFLFPLSSFDLTLFLASAAILWLVGNGLLLRAPARNQNQ